MKHKDEMPYLEYHDKSKIEKSLTTMEGILKGIAIDEIINRKEIKSLTE